MSGTPSQKGKAPNDDFPWFSPLTALFIGGVTLLTQVAVDGLQVIWPLSNPMNILAQGLAGFLHILPVFGYGFLWWPPVFLLMVGCYVRFGPRAIISMLAGVFVFVIMLHSFKGMAPRHNVFEMADMLRQNPSRDVPAPFWWDMSYFLVSLAGIGAGSLWLKLLPVHRTPCKPVEDATLVWTGIACLVAGVVELPLIHFLVVPRNRDMIGQAPYTQEYALLVYGVVVWVLARYREQLFDLELR